MLWLMGGLKSAAAGNVLLSGWRDTVYVPLQWLQFQGVEEAGARVCIEPGAVGAGRGM